MSLNLQSIVYKVLLKNILITDAVEKDTKFIYFYLLVGILQKKLVNCDTYNARTDGPKILFPAPSSFPPELVNAIRSAHGGRIARSRLR